MLYYCIIEVIFCGRRTETLILDQYHRFITHGQGYKTDRKDLHIMRMLVINSRASYQSIGHEVGLSSNAVKTRIRKMMDGGAIMQYDARVKLEAFGQ